MSRRKNMTAKIYTTNACAYCKMVKTYLTHKGVQYTEVNIDNEPDKRKEAWNISGAYTVPITIINDKIVIGWKPGELAKAIA
jgi:glutaredoxin